MQIWGVLCLGLAVRALALGWLGSGLAEPRLEPFAVDLNTADLPTLQTLPGIGQSRAEAIVLERLRHGPLRRLEELDRVDGIGPVVRERLRPWVVPLDATGGGARR
ncbi:MAG: helix-hairpin-helix domain-containing protein [Planctomycetes bacterium]|nr:helix-hairpin-helix domain-containing protein [Planctomycetota bacterium]